jgi:hypothetical protein
VADAQQHAEQLVAEHVITQRAQQMAEQTHLDSVRESEEMRAQADGYAYEVLNKAGMCCSACRPVSTRARNKSARADIRLRYVNFGLRTGRIESAVRAPCL